MPAPLHLSRARALSWLAALLSVIASAGTLALIFAPSSCPYDYSRAISEGTIVLALGPATLLFLGVSLSVLLQLYRHPNDNKITNTGVTLLLIGSILLVAAVLPQTIGLLGNQHYGCSLNPAS